MRRQLPEVLIGNWGTLQKPISRFLNHWYWTARRRSELIYSQKALSCGLLLSFDHGHHKATSPLDAEGYKSFTYGYQDRLWSFQRSSTVVNVQPPVQKEWLLYLLLLGQAGTWLETVSSPPKGAVLFITRAVWSMVFRNLETMETYNI